MFYILISILLADIASIGLSKLLRKDGVEDHHNMRWFFVHFFVNFMITYLAFNDVKTCFQNFNECPTIGWSDDSESASHYAILVHIYHVVFFYKHLRFDEWFHHIVMCCIAFPIMFTYNREINSITALWFITGLPGMIDYFLLWLVKLGRLEKDTEKYIYVMIAVIIRSPGCILSAASGLLVLNLAYTTVNLARWFLVFVTIWNGQYYMYVTVKSSTRANII